MAGPVRIAVLGADGRMGRALVRAVRAAGPGATLAAACEHAGHPSLGKDAGAMAGGESIGFSDGHQRMRVPSSAKVVERPRFAGRERLPGPLAQKVVADDQQSPWNSSTGGCRKERRRIGPVDERFDGEGRVR